MLRGTNNYASTSPKKKIPKKKEETVMITKFLPDEKATAINRYILDLTFTLVHGFAPLTVD